MNLEYGAAPLELVQVIQVTAPGAHTRTRLAGIHQLTGTTPSDAQRRRFTTGRRSHTLVVRDGGERLGINQASVQPTHSRMHWWGCCTVKKCETDAHLLQLNSLTFKPCALRLLLLMYLCKLQ